MSQITNLIDDYLKNNVPGKGYLRRNRAEMAMTEFETLVGDRDQALKGAEEYKKLYETAARLLNTANYKLSKIKDILKGE